jgi:hypothetical protein
VLAERVGDSDLRRILLNEVKRLVPRPRGDVESVELYGRGIPELARVRLTRELHERIDSAIDRAERETIESYEGDLREIDLDNLTLTLRNVGGAVYQVACEFGPDLYDTALDALGRRVEVSGVRRLEKGRGRAGRLRVTRLVILDEGGDGSSADPAG